MFRLDPKPIVHTVFNISKEQLQAYRGKCKKKRNEMQFDKSPWPCSNVRKAKGWTRKEEEAFLRSTRGAREESSELRPQPGADILALHAPRCIARLTLLCSSHAVSTAQQHQMSTTMLEQNGEMALRPAKAQRMTLRPTVNTDFETRGGLVGGWNQMEIDVHHSTMHVPFFASTAQRSMCVPLYLVANCIAVKFTAQPATFVSHASEENDNKTKTE